MDKCPILSGEDISGCCFIRVTNEDVYTLMEDEYTLDDIIKRIIVPPTSKQDVFTLSVFLYVDDYLAKIHPFPKFDDNFSLYLYTDKLYNIPIVFSGDMFTSSFSHNQTNENYWHFQLFTKDSDGNIIPRDKKNARFKHLAKHILENIVVRAICQKYKIKPFTLADYNSVLDQC